MIKFVLEKLKKTTPTTTTPTTTIPTAIEDPDTDYDLMVKDTIFLYIFLFPPY
jgi:hypothetical protein